MSTTTSPRVDLTGRTLMNKLQVVRLVGEGGMGAVYEVEHLITKHRRALKVMHGQFAASTETVARFIREAGVAGTLRTPYVVETYDAGQLDDGSPYVLMELLDGRSLAGVYEAAQASGRMSVGRLVGLVCQVLEGLSVAHRAGIVHRDIKPDNVFVCRDERGDRVRILDFGISKFTSGKELEGTLTAEGAMMGTPYYMSPEQTVGARELDARSDLYAVGVMLYEGLAGRRPYEATTLPALLLKVHQGDHVALSKASPDLPRGLADVVERAMSTEPSERFQTAEEMLAALVPFAESQLVTSLQTIRTAGVLADTVAATSGGQPATRVGSEIPTIDVELPKSKTPAPWLVAGAVALVGVVGLGFLAMGGSSTTVEMPPAPVDEAPRHDAHVDAPDAAVAEVAEVAEPDAGAPPEAHVERPARGERPTHPTESTMMESPTTMESPEPTTMEPTSMGSSMSGERFEIERDVPF